MRSEISTCIVDNIHLENYAENLLNVYFPFTKPSSHLTIKTVPPVVHAYGIPQVVESHITVTSKYTNTNF